MKRFIMCINVLAIIACVIFSSCAKSSSSLPLSNTITTSTPNSTQAENASTDSVTTSAEYWDIREIPQYAGLFNKSNKVGGTLHAIKVGATTVGEIFEVFFDLETGVSDTINPGDLELGYFYVQKDKILRVQKSSISKEDAKNGSFPKSSSIVFQNKATTDSLRQEEDGEHEWITVEKNQVTYHYCYFQKMLRSYEEICWEKGVGIISYRSGYGAGRDEIYVKFTAETMSPKQGLQPLLPQVASNSKKFWPIIDGD